MPLLSARGITSELMYTFLYAMCVDVRRVSPPTRAKGLVPLPGVKTTAQADEVVGCLGWWLQQDDVDMLDAAHTVSNFAAT